MEKLSIGQLAQRVGVNIETIRYYERIGLLQPPKRTSNGRRAYDQNDLGNLYFVRHARDLGFSIEEIRSLITHRTSEDACVHVKAIAKNRLEKLRAELRRTAEIEKMLANAVEACSAAGPAAQCAVLKILESGT